MRFVIEVYKAAAIFWIRFVADAIAIASILVLVFISYGLMQLLQRPDVPLLAVLLLLGFSATALVIVTSDFLKRIKEGKSL